MKRVLAFFKTLNELFIKAVLFIFYYVVIGIVSLFYRVFKIKQKNKSSYWLEVKDEVFDRNYFNSPY